MRTIPARVDLRVLLVDDNQDQYVLTRGLLKDDLASHFDLDWAANFEEGLRLFAAGGYDVALIDYRLGVRNGLELLQTDTVRHAGVPAIMLTGEGDARVDAEAMAVGAVDYLVKDEVTAPRLKRALRQAVERHRVVMRLQQREESLRALIEDSADVILLVDRGGNIQYASDSVRHVEGCRSDELLGLPLFERIHPADVERVRNLFEVCVRQPGGRSMFEYRQQHQDGSWRYREATIFNRLRHPGIAAVVVTYRDVTSRKQAGAEQAHLAAIVESSDDAIFGRTLDGTILSWNKAAQRLYGYSALETVGHHVSMLASAEVVPTLPALFGRVSAGECVRPHEVICVRKDGTAVQVLLNVSPLRDHDGRVIGASSMAHDITERKGLHSAAIDSEAEYRSTFDDTPVGMAHANLDGGYTRINRRLKTMLGYSIEHWQESDLAALTHPDDLPRNADARARLLAGDITRFVNQQRYRQADGGYVWATLTMSLHRDTAGLPKYFIAVVENIANRKQAQQELDHIFNLSLDMICTANESGLFTRTNAAWSRTLGYTADELRGRSVLAFVHPDDQAATAAALARLVQGQTTIGFTNRCQTTDGSYRWIEWYAKADAAAHVIYAVARDQTERRLLEQKLLQVQNLDAVGQLAASVAHDFISLLTVIAGYSEFLLDLPPGEDGSREAVEQIQKAGERLAEPTHMLLAFATKPFAPDGLDPDNQTAKPRRCLTP